MQTIYGPPPLIVRPGGMLIRLILAAGAIAAAWYFIFR